MATADATLPQHRESQALVYYTMGRLMQAVSKLERLPTAFFSRWAQAGVDLLLAATSIYVAYQLRFEGEVPLPLAPVMWTLVLLMPTARALSAVAVGSYNSIWRYYGMRDASRLLLATLPPTAVLLILRLFFHRSIHAQLPLTVTVIDWGVFLLAAMSARWTRRALYEAGRREITNVRRALVIGTESTLAPALHQVETQPDIRLLGLLAPTRELHGSKIGGHAVLDDPSNLTTVLAATRADLVLIADANVAELGGIMRAANDLGVEARLLPSAANVLSGGVRVHTTPRPEMVLTHRSELSTDTHPAVGQAFRGRTVLVTGAGGSIGSELCRQVLSLDVERLVLVDHDENSIFEIHAELQGVPHTCELEPVVGDIRNAVDMRRVFKEQQPHVILHAAAFKHVPVMEKNPSQAVLNNVMGTREVLDLALEFKAERFLMISTDKAVRPSSVMGASKRVAEMLVQARAASLNGSCPTRLACVRFGNVLGSRGSVLPIFLRQIAAGGPVTITHEEMTRYFMTIPEAVQLVLQASTLGSHGDVYMLDMGDPVRIADMARRLIEMSGLRPEKDIAIKVVGARPGEKLHEQLWYEDARVEQTAFPRVFRVLAGQAPVTFYDDLDELEAVATARQDEAIVERLSALPIKFRREAFSPTAAN